VGSDRRAARRLGTVESRAGKGCAFGATFDQPLQLRSVFDVLFGDFRSLSVTTTQSDVMGCYGTMPREAFSWGNGPRVTVTGPFVTGRTGTIWDIWDSPITGVCDRGRIAFGRELCTGARR
jgi:hypothetical protein